MRGRSPVVRGLPCPMGVTILDGGRIMNRDRRLTVVLALGILALVTTAGWNVLP